MVRQPAAVREARAEGAASFAERIFAPALAAAREVKGEEGAVLGGGVGGVRAADLQDRRPVRPRRPLLLHVHVLPRMRVTRLAAASDHAVQAAALPKDL